jgi:TonB family protein
MKQRLNLVMLLLLICSGSHAQEKVIQYYDSLWTRTDAAKATYRTEFIKEGDIYRCYSYVKETGALYSRSAFADTVFAKPKDVLVTYYPDGKAKDSTFFDKDGLMLRGFIFYPSGKKQAFVHRQPGTKDLVAEGFDQSGKQIENFVYTREASFKGGDEGWSKYLLKKVRKDFYNTKSDETLRVSAMITFQVDKDGSVIAAALEKSSGIAEIDNDALHVISESPKWNNAIYLNEPIKVYRRQPLTYELIPSKKKK